MDEIGKPGPDEVFKKFGEKSEFRYFNRGLDGYLNRLFSDDQEDDSSIEDETTESPKSNPYFGLVAIPKFEPVWHHWDLKGVYTSEEEAHKLCGGQEGFFSPEASILDLGAGGGTAAKEISETYPDTKVVALDIRYGEQRPEEENRNGPLYVCGRWNDMPFADNSFDRILAYESFPKYAWSENSSLEDVEHVFQEITRVARPGTIWRGTWPREVAKKESEKNLIDMAIENGWEIYMDQSKGFVAKLVRKEHSRDNHLAEIGTDKS